MILLNVTASEHLHPVTFHRSGAITETLLFRIPSGNTWTAVYTADANDTDGAVSYSIAFSDTAGNAGSAVTVEVVSQQIQRRLPSAMWYCSIIVPLR